MFQIQSDDGLSLGVPSSFRLVRSRRLADKRLAFGYPCRSLGPVRCQLSADLVGWMSTPMICLKAAAAITTTSSCSSNIGIYIVALFEKKYKNNVAIIVTLCEIANTSLILSKQKKLCLPLHDLQLSIDISDTFVVFLS